MRKLITSVVVALALVAAFMVLADTSLASRPGVDSTVDDNPPPVRVRMVSLRGTITDVPTDTVGVWTVTDEADNVWTVTVTEETRIVPPMVDPAVGDPVHVLGTQEEDGEQAVTAKQIVVKKRDQQPARPVQFRGEIEKLPASTDTVTGPEAYYGEWVVAGFTVTVDADTMIHPDKRTPEVGMTANVIAFEQADGTLWAKNIVLHRPEEEESEVEIEGLIEALPDAPYLGTWIVDGFTVTVTDTTELKGATPAVSLTAKVKGQELEDDTILAEKIIVEGPEHEMVEFEGKVLVYTDTRPSEWVIERETPTGTEQVSVTVTSDTFVNTNKGPVEVGALVEVKALRQTDGTLVAVLIKVEDEVDEDTKIVFEGTVVATDTIPGDWVIQTDSERITVEVTSETKIVPPWASLELGSEVKVLALQQADGSLQAFLIKIERPNMERVKIEGTVVATDTIPGDWVIQTDSEEVTVEVTAETKIVPPWESLSLGDEVKVIALEQADGSLQAFLIKIERHELERIEIEGTVVATDTIPGDWVIETDSERVTVEVTAETVVLPVGETLSLGDEVDIEAVEESDGTLRALVIEIEDEEPELDELTFEGTVVTTDTIPGDWVIETDSERITVEVTAETVVLPAGASLSLGDEVAVVALEQADGSLEASLITILVDVDDVDPTVSEETVQRPSVEPASRDVAGPSWAQSYRRGSQPQHWRALAGPSTN